MTGDPGAPSRPGITPLQPRIDGEEPGNVRLTPETRTIAGDSSLLTQDASPLCQMHAVRPTLTLKCAGSVLHPVPALHTEHIRPGPPVPMHPMQHSPVSDAPHLSIAGVHTSV